MKENKWGIEMRFKNVEITKEQVLCKDIVESERFPGYYICHHDEMILVSPSGSIIYSKTGWKLEPVINFWGYLAYDRINDTVHRLVATVFLECPGDPEEMIVNHFDGDKLNNALENLHWGTRSDNAVHAFISGLRNDNKKILVKNLESGEIVELYSLNELARQFEVNPSAISIYMKSKRDVPFKDKYTMIFSSESHWPNLTKDDIGKHRNGLPKSVMVKLTDGKRYVFSSVGHAAEYLGVKSHMFYSHLNGGVKCLKKYNVEEIRYIYNPTEVDGEIMPSPVREKFTPKRTPVPIEVTNLITKETKTYRSCEEFADLMGVKRNTFQKNISSNGRWKEYKVIYLK